MQLILHPLTVLPDVFAILIFILVRPLYDKYHHITIFHKLQILIRCY